MEQQYRKLSPSCIVKEDFEKRFRNLVILGTLSKPRRQRQRERGKKKFYEQNNGSARA